MCLPHCFIFSCISAHLGGATSGVGTVLAYALEAGLQDIGFGFSLTNAFEIEIPLFTGEKFIDYKAHPTTFDTISLEIGSDKIHDSLEDLFSISGRVKRGLIINAPTGQPLDEKTVSDRLERIDATEKDDDDSGDLMNHFQDFTVQAIMQGKATINVNFTSIEVIAKYMPDFEFELAQGAAFISTGKQTIIDEDGESVVVYPGMSTFIGSAGGASMLKNMIEKIFDSIDGIVVSTLYCSIFSWLKGRHRSAHPIVSHHVIFFFFLTRANCSQAAWKK